MASGRKIIQGSSYPNPFGPKQQNGSTPTAGPSISAPRDGANNKPSPELIRLEQKLKTLAHNVTKALPYPLGTSRLEFSRLYQQQLKVFKEKCLQQCKTFIDNKQWKQAIDYIVMAWPIVDLIPILENPSHNKVREQTYKKLASSLTNSLKKGKFQKQELQDYIEKFRKCAYYGNGMIDAIELAETILTKII